MTTYSGFGTCIFMKWVLLLKTVKILLHHTSNQIIFFILKKKILLEMSSEIRVGMKKKKSIIHTKPTKSELNSKLLFSHNSLRK